MKARKLIKFIWLFSTLCFVSCGQSSKQQEQSFVQELNNMLEWPQGGTYSDEVIQFVFDYIE